MKNKASEKSHYRWIMLASYFLITVMVEIHWLSFASISEVAQQNFHATPLQIDFLSMLYMIVFIVLSIPASYIIDTYGLKRGLLIGAWFTGIFGLVKATGGNNFTLLIVGQTGLAIGQPFILNSLTKLGALWFPPNERATVAGIGTLAQYVGIVIALALTPFLINENPDQGFHLSRMLWIYGLLTAVSAFLVVILVKDEPEPSKGNKALRISPKRSLKFILNIRDMQFLLILFFIGLGIFNAVSTCIDQICDSLNMEQTGIVGGAMLIGGIAGAIILPILSDKMEKRKPFIVLCIFLMLPGLAGLTYFDTFWPMLFSSFFFGFFIMSAGPIAFQYGAEMSYPATESMVQGLLLLIGQISGILFVYGLNIIGVSTIMLIFMILNGVIILLSFGLRESFKKDHSAESSPS
ncbi:MAG: MFS transporter [Prolixibacteraceae bacterium]|nr:MFS transporter [Prolixibacteraceae bacterium]